MKPSSGLALAVIVLSVASVYAVTTTARAESTQYVLHVLMNGPVCSMGFAIYYSGSYSGAEGPPFDIGPYSSPFTVTLTATNWFAHTGQLCAFAHWTLDGSEINSPSIQVTVDSSNPSRTVEAYYVIFQPLLAGDLTNGRDAPRSTLPSSAS